MEGQWNPPLPQAAQLPAAAGQKRPPEGVEYEEIREQVCFVFFFMVVQSRFLGAHSQMIIPYY